MKTLCQLAGIIALFFAVTPANAGESRDFPNIIVIMADDLGWGDISANGSDMISTPNIDRLAEQGIRLTSFYAGSNVCTPSRAALMTGRYPIRSGMQHVVMPHHDGGLPQSEFTIAELMKNAKYATGMVGKWHLGHQEKHWPTEHGFDEFYGVAYSNDMKPFDLYHHKTVVQSPVDQQKLTDRYASAATDFIARNADRPFFLYYAETFPHIPLFVPDDKAKQSKAGLYGDVVEHLDAGIGRIMKALDKHGLTDNTLIIVTSDNGPWFEGDGGPMRGRKGETFEGGYRVPFIARWPGKFRAGSLSKEMAMNIDLLPTLASITGQELPKDRTIDGRDISAMLAKGEPSPHETLFFFDGNNIAAVRDNRYRLVLNGFYRNFPVPFEQFGAALLFDLKTDPLERFNYLRDNPEVYKKLMSKVQDMRKEVEVLKKDPEEIFPSPDSDALVGPQLSKKPHHH